MTKKEAINELVDMANALQIIPTSRKGQALQMAIIAIDGFADLVDDNYIKKYEDTDENNEQE